MIQEFLKKLWCLFKGHDREESISDFGFPLEVNAWCSKCGKPLFNK